MDEQFLCGVREALDGIMPPLLAKANLQPGELFVLGCSTSEVAGSRIGTASSQELGTLIVDTLRRHLEPLGAVLAVGCCEHLNRCLVVPREAALRHRLPIVCVRPALHAGGACGTHYFDSLPEPAMVERLQAKAGLDIGHTLIGMHLEPVAVPFRCEISQVGCAPVVMATTRPKYVGGPRATYP